MCLSSTCVALVVKMCRLWATTCQDVSSLGRGASVCVLCLSSTCVALVVKMCRLWATTCKDVSSLGRGASVCVCVCPVHV